MLVTRTLHVLLRRNCMQSRLVFIQVNNESDYCFANQSNPLRGFLILSEPTGNQTPNDSFQRSGTFGTKTRKSPNRNALWLRTFKRAVCLPDCLLCGLWLLLLRKTDCRPRSAEKLIPRYRDLLPNRSLPRRTNRAGVLKLIAVCSNNALLEISWWYSDYSLTTTDCLLFDIS